MLGTATLTICFKVTIEFGATFFAITTVVSVPVITGFNVEVGEGLGAADGELLGFGVAEGVGDGVGVADGAGADPPPPPEVGAGVEDGVGVGVKVQIAYSVMAYASEGIVT